MKTLLRFLIAASLAGILGSCKHPYTDSSAASGSTLPPSATLTAPSLGPDDAPAFSNDVSKTVLSYVTGSDGYVAIMAGDVAAVVSGLAYSSSESLTTSSGSGLSGYSLVSPYTYGITTDSNGSSTYIVNSTSTSTGSSSNEVYQTYEEESAAYASPVSGVAKLYKKALHYVDSLTETDNNLSVALSSPSVTIAGNRILKTHGEWYQDQYLLADGTVSYGLQYGIAEISVGAALSVYYTTTNLDSNGKTIIEVGKFVVSVVESTPYGYNTSSGTIGTGTNTATVSIVVKAYDNNDKLVYTGTFSSASAYTCTLVLGG
jgi:hypothetical protein